MKTRDSCTRTIYWISRSGWQILRLEKSTRLWLTSRSVLLKRPSDTHYKPMMIEAISAKVRSLLLHYFPIHEEAFGTATQICPRRSRG